MNKPLIRLLSTGSYAPSTVLTNNDLAARMDTSDEWIRTRTGIRERRIATKDETTSDMAIEAARKAIQKANLTPEDIDLVVVATVTGDYVFPASACMIQHKLGLRPVPAFDLSAACTGFIYALHVTQSMLESGPYRNALVIGADRYSSIVDWEDRSTCVLFGDGAGAAVLTREESQKGWRIVDSLLGASGGHTEILYVPERQADVANPTVPRSDCVQMEGKEVFKHAVRYMGSSVEELLKRNHLTAQDIRIIIPHQANERIISALAKQWDIPIERFFMNLQFYGNTSAASIPIAFDEFLEHYIPQVGDYSLMVAFGAGLTWGATLLRLT